MNGTSSVGARRGRTAAAVRRLGTQVTELGWDAVPATVRERIATVVTDLVGVTLAGAVTAEQRTLRRATAPGPGPARVIGTSQDTALETAVWLNGAAACCLELDEGNKRARGHPLAHTAFAALAVAQQRRAAGPELGAALLVGYEVAARFGAATRLAPGVHPHGNWGAAGAAAAVARLWGCEAATTAAAIDAATALVLTTPFRAALTGNEVRDSWLGLAGQHGLTAARLAVAGRTRIDGMAADTLGGPLGTFAVSDLELPFGDPWHVSDGYVKRHACCAYTHPPADATLAVLADHAGALDPADVEDVEVATNALAAPLDGAAPVNRLAAMFSIPYVVAAVLRHGDVSPRRFDASHRDDPAQADLAGRVRVVVDPDLDAQLPAHRPCRVTVTLADGRTLVGEVPDAVGDVDHRPFGRRDVIAKLDGLAVPGLSGAALAEQIDRLLAADDVADVLTSLPTPEEVPA